MGDTGMFGKIICNNLERILFILLLRYVRRITSVLIINNLERILLILFLIYVRKITLYYFQYFDENIISF